MATGPPPRRDRLAVEVDFNPTAADYSAHRPGFPEELFIRLKALGAGLPGQRVVDLGTGTGALARGFARVGCVVTGVDIAGALLAEAERRNAAASLEIAYRLARAECTGLPGGCWDVVAAGQCWHWFDRGKAASEARRLLGSAGCLVICHHDYLALAGNICAATEALILEFNPGWKRAGSTGMYPAWTIDASSAGFDGIETFSFDGRVEFSHEGWRGRMRTCNGIGASLPPERVAEFDRALARLLSEAFPAEPLLCPIGSGRWWRESRRRAESPPLPLDASSDEPADRYSRHHLRRGQCRPSRLGRGVQPGG